MNLSALPTVPPKIIHVPTKQELEAAGALDPARARGDPIQGRLLGEYTYTLSSQVKSQYPKISREGGPPNFRRANSGPHEGHRLLQPSSPHLAAMNLGAAEIIV